MKIIVTGGAGFIGSAVIREAIKYTSHTILNVDSLTYAGNLASLAEVESSERYSFQKIDITDRPKIDKVFSDFEPDAVMNLAAESHVDRSIEGPSDFINTNIIGTYTLLEAARKYWNTLSDSGRDSFRFHHISTDEVFGDLGFSDEQFHEGTAYSPSSPYSASKASSDHLVRAWYRTYGLPSIVTNCSNNYGPYHFPEKLIPHIIINALKNNPLPVYGDGRQIRDWLYVEDHARALLKVVERGVVGESYNVGGNNEVRNIDVVNSICNILDEVAPRAGDGKQSYRELITFVADRPGHDVRYAIDARKIKNELGWSPVETFETGIRKTVFWYLDNKKWWEGVLNGSYRLNRIGG